MKTSIFAILVILCSAAFAKNSDDVQGAQATKLLAALQATGSQMDCGMGRCGTAVQDIRCSGDNCSLKIENENGGSTDIAFEGQAAIDLMNALMNAGAPVTALWSIAEVDCTTTNAPDGGPDSCRIDYN